MKRAILLLAASAAFGQTKWPNDLVFRFNGIGLAMHTESSAANSPLSTSGSVSVGKNDVSHRLVLDKASNPIFAYDIELRRAPAGVALRIRPVDQEQIRSESWFPKDKVKGDIPTLAVPRDFPPLHVGDAVQVDILYHPVTGEKIWDVLRVIPDDPTIGGTAARPKPKANPFSFEQVRVAVNGKTVHENRAWMIGSAIMMRIPHMGDYYLTLSPPANFPFQASGWVDHQVMRFHAGSDSVEVTGKSNLLQDSEFGTVWVYYDPESPARAEKSGFDFVCADNIEWILPKKHAKQE